MLKFEFDPHEWELMARRQMSHAWLYIKEDYPALDEMLNLNGIESYGEEEED